MSRGSRGYSQQPPDLTSRLVGPPGHPAPQGAAPYRYYNPSGRRRALRDSRGRVITPVSPRAREIGEVDGLGREARMLARVLNDAIGINIRQPSSNVPPFRAQQWTRRDTGSIAGAGSITRNVSFDNSGNSTPVPAGVRGVLTLLKCWVFPDNLGSIANLTSARLTLFRNEVAVPGFTDVSVGYTQLEEITDVDGAEYRGATIDPFEVLVPAKLEEGDILTIQIFAGSTNADFHLQASGWFYPIEQQGDNVTGTVADRGNVEGLIRRGGY